MSTTDYRAELRRNALKRETTRERKSREALTRAAGRAHAHELRFGASPEPAPEYVLRVSKRGGEHDTIRVNRRGATMPLGVFAALDYGQLCQWLGLSPSRPHADATGKVRRPKRSRRRRGRRREAARA